MRMGVVGLLALGLLMAGCGSSEDQRAGTSALNEADPGLVGGSWPSLSSEHLVRRAQSELKREGLYEGRVDGIAGTQTRQAITAFQQREGLQQNARVDRVTLRRMTLNALRMDGALNVEAPSIATPEGAVVPIRPRTAGAASAPATEATHISAGRAGKRTALGAVLTGRWLAAIRVI